MNISDFQGKIGYFFSDESLLNEALTHPSVNNRNLANYQRLEFFGDKVLGLVVAEYLMQNFPQDSEGDLSKKYAFIVSCDCLAQVALDIGVDKIINLSQGEINNKGAIKKSNLENCLEAIIGAIYIDSGLEDAKTFILDNFSQKLILAKEPPIDFVSRFQEYVQEKTKFLPEIVIERIDGSDHDPIFEAHIVVEQLGINVRAKGNSKKEANKLACKKALQQIIPAS